jgi:trk system potassium uptake protein TrkA
VVYPEKQMGEQLAKSLIVSGVIDHVVLPTGQTVAHIRLREDFIGKTLRDCLLLERFRLAVIGIQQPKRGIDDRGELHEELILIPMPDLDTVINEDDILIVVGMQNQIDLVSRRE